MKESSKTINECRVLYSELNLHKYGNYFIDVNYTYNRILVYTCIPVIEMQIINCVYTL